ncbi:TPA: hypothetical protein ACGO2X_001555 [Streptococcus suis]
MYDKNIKIFFKVLNYFSQKEGYLDWGDQLYSCANGLPVFYLARGMDYYGNPFIKVEYYADLEKKQLLDQEYFKDSDTVARICEKIEQKILLQTWWLDAEHYASSKIFGLINPLGVLKVIQEQTGIQQPFSCTVREVYEVNPLNKHACHFEISIDVNQLRIGEWYEIYLDEYQRTMCEWGEMEKVHYFLWHSSKWLLGMSVIKPDYIPNLQEWLQIEKLRKRDGFRFRILSETKKGNHIWLRFSWLFLESVCQKEAVKYLLMQLE